MEAIIGALAVLTGVLLQWLTSRSSERARNEREDALRFVNARHETYSRFAGLIHERRAINADAAARVERLAQQVEALNGAAVPPELDAELTAEGVRVGGVEALIESYDTPARQAIADMTLVAPPAIVDLAYHLADLPLGTPDDEHNAVWTQWVAACRADLGVEQL